MTRSPDAGETAGSAGELDLRAISAALKRRRRLIVVSTVLAFIGMSIFVNVVTPRYTAETRVLLENQETFFTRPDRPNLQPEQAAALDPEAVASQVDLITSYDLARRAIKQLDLRGKPEFDPLAGGLGPLSRILVLLGVLPDLTRETVEQRMIAKFSERLTVFSPPKTRIIAIQFSSRDPDLAMRGANLVAQLYLQEQASAKRAHAHLAAQALEGEISDLRTKVVAADDELQQYRAKTGLLAGTNNVTISSQQLSEINTDLSNARARQADAQAKASMIRDLIRSGRGADINEIITNDLVRRITEQRVSAQAQLALEARTLLPGHPHIKALAAQVDEYNLALKSAAKQAELSLENEARIAAQRVQNLEAALTQQKAIVGSDNVDEVHLRALQRVADTLKEQLESASTKYQEALARETSIATPPDARVISSASRPQEPSFPKKVPFVAFATVAVFVFVTGLVIAGELLSDGSPAAAARVSRDAPIPVMPRVRPRRVAERETEAPASFTEDPDPVFAPVTPDVARRERAESLGLLANGGMLGATFAYLKTFGRSAAASRASGMLKEPDLRSLRSESARPPSVPLEAAGAPSADRSDVAGVAERVVGAHVPGRGLHVVGTSTGREAASERFIDLGRALAVKGRAIMVDLNRMPANLAPLAGKGEEGSTRILAQRGLAELLANEATFAEVIHRDQASRLHYIPSGLQEADFRDFDLILDALAETYDFILMLAPNYPQSEIAKIVAPYTDFVVLTTSGSAQDRDMLERKAELLEAGAREVLIVGLPRSRQDVA